MTTTTTTIMTTAEAGRLLGVTPAAVRRMHRRGLLRADRTETGVRVYRRADVLALAARRDAERDAAGRRPHGA